MHAFLPIRFHFPSSCTRQNTKPALKQDSRRDGQHACNAQGHRVLLSHAGSTTDHARCGAAGWRSLAVWGQSAVNGQLTCGSSYKHDGSGNRLWIARAAAQEPPQSCSDPASPTWMRAWVDAEIRWHLWDGQNRGEKLIIDYHALFACPGPIGE